MSELLPCPSGHAVKLSMMSEGGGRFHGFIKCSEPSCRWMMDNYELRAERTEQQARDDIIAAWNSRAPAGLLDRMKEVESVGWVFTGVEWDQYNDRPIHYNATFRHRERDLWANGYDADWQRAIEQAVDDAKGRIK